MRHTATLWFLLVAISLSGHAHADNNDARVKAIHKKLAALTEELHQLEDSNEKFLPRPNEMLFRTPLPLPLPPPLPLPLPLPLDTRP